MTPFAVNTHSSGFIIKNNQGYYIMDKLTVSFSACAGMSLSMPDGILWIDALHDKKTTVYSTLSPELIDYMFNDSGFVGEDKHGPDIIAFTHCHTDHFSSRLCRIAKSNWPDTRLMLPHSYFPEQLLIDGDRTDTMLGTTRISFIRSRHSGKERLHKSYFMHIYDGETSILISGDTSLSDPVFKEFAAENHIDIAFMNYTWLLFAKGRSVIEDIIQPKYLIISHLPFEEDDKAKLRGTAFKGASMLKGIDDIRLLTEPKQKEILILK